MNLIEGNITTPKGFRAAGAAIGIKKNGKKDLCLLASDMPATAAGVFTTNVVKAAPVAWDMEIVSSGKPVRGLVVNSGNANACTGQQGVDDTQAMAAAFAGGLQARADEVLVCSTGVIGVPLPIAKITNGITATAPTLGGTPADGTAAVEAIMTTDTFAKTVAAKLTLPSGGTVCLGGMAKGSGMIHPNMATMLGFVTTDCAISQPLFAKALKAAADDTFNMVSVDGDTSTNDTLLALANGAAGNTPIESENADYAAFASALMAVCKKLAIDVARDGEGATRLLEITVTGAKTEADARTLARSVSASSLFKAMMFGADANFGRVLCAMGYSGAGFNPDKADIAFRDESGRKLSVMENGVPLGFDEDYAKQVLTNPTVYIDITLADGAGKATAWGCDLTYDYVKINGDYRS